jgi:Phosphotransferase enzyme family
VNDGEEKMKGRRRNEALDAAVAVARELGLPVREPVVLRESSSVIVLLAPGGPVARVAGLTAAVRDNRAHRTRELAVARRLAAAGAPVVAPYEPAGPHEHGGQLLTLWQKAATEPAPTADEIGASLRACHTALRTYEGELPPLRALLDEAVAVLGRSVLEAGDRALVRDGLAAVAGEIAAFEMPVQPLHGDAGLGNVLAGPAWNDWEDACVGPVAWDLACLVTTARVTGEQTERAEGALASYGLDLPEPFVQARALQVIAWSGFAAAAGVGRTRLARRLDWLRSQLG